MSTVTTQDMARWVNNSGLFMGLDQAVEEGRFWVIKTKGEALITTAKTIEGIKTLALFGIAIDRLWVEQCDYCYGYSFSCAGQDLGPEDEFSGEMIAVIWYCHDCMDKEEG